MFKFLLLFFLTSTSFHSFGLGNKANHSFNKAKRILETKVYYDNRQTLYCLAMFDAKKYVTPPSGFVTTKHIKRSKKIEWEHVVPAENFGRTFAEWKLGDKACVNSKGKSFKGRRCAEKLNYEYRYMQADMHNLFPAIGAVNAMRSNYNFTMLPSVKSGFGSCDMRIDNRKAQPPVESRGRIARTYMYMETAYPRYKMSNQQKQLMNAWNKMYPVSEWECQRAYRIKKIQNNANSVVEGSCKLAEN